MASHQDMPPPGGFAEIPIARTYPKTMIRQGIWVALMIALTLNGVEYMREWRKRYRIMKVEQTEHFIAASPFILAEQERKFLKHLRAIREDERELMKDHPGWRVGTLYGEPIFKTLPPNQLPPISSIDFRAHGCSRGEWVRYNRLPDSHQ